MSTLLRSFTLSGLIALFTQWGTAASLGVYISAPGSESTFVSGATTATFDSAKLGNYITSYFSNIGTYNASATNSFRIQTADQFGGAGGTQYFTFGAQSGVAAPITLQLAGNNTYFGFYWSAGDANNGISFYTGNTLLARISTGDIVNFLTPTTGRVTAQDGTKYRNSLYYGNPENNTQDTAEPFAYISIVTAGATFNKIVFDNSNSLASGFESDNHSIYSGTVTVPGSAVFVETVQAPAVPEPASLGLLLIGGTALLGTRAVGRLLKSRRS